jgi:hypothetical protein
MQGVSAAYIATQQTSHTAVVSAIVLTLDGKIIINLEPHAGSVTSDRTAAQLTTFEFEIIDRLGVLAPTSMTSLLAPFGALVQVLRGAEQGRGHSDGDLQPGESVDSRNDEQRQNQFL